MNSPNDKKKSPTTVGQGFSPRGGQGGLGSPAPALETHEKCRQCGRHFSWRREQGIAPRCSAPPFAHRLEYKHSDDFAALRRTLRLLLRKSAGSNHVRRKINNAQMDVIYFGGENRIRTCGTIAGTHAFQACSFNHSDTSPRRRSLVCFCFRVNSKAATYRYASSQFNKQQAWFGKLGRDKSRQQHCYN